MLLCVTLLLLLGLSACTVAGDKELAVNAEVGSWEDVIPSILLQLRDVKKGKASQFFGLMGKQVGGIPPIQSEGTGKCCPHLPPTCCLGKTELSGRWGRCSGQGAQAGIVEGGARVVWLHRLPGWFLGEVVCVHRGSSCKDEEMVMNPVLPKVQNYHGSKA
ncbi:PREDICTED: tachykinin-4 [Bison bison bison]|uniref:Tachykinin-4 n=1 Tax=Bison bison bison TaxID=43346 RepID=A0A6P3HRC6_BISBB|nr:PREDICTED: tachykinin-4 [Bison bison bison]